MNKTFKKTLKYWYVYAAAIAISVAGSIYYCDLINLPRNEETISLFVSTYGKNSSEIHSFLKAKSPQYLREINLFCIDPMSADFDYYMVNKGLNQADIFILREGYLFEKLINDQFAPLKSDIVNEYFSYETDSSGKGILFHKKDEEDHPLISVKNEKYDDENYYIFYRVNSLHISGLNDSKFDTALKFTKALLEYE